MPIYEYECRGCRHRFEATELVQRANGKVTRDKAWADHEYDKTHRHE